MLKLLQQLEIEFKGKKMFNQTENNNLKYIIDPRFVEDNIFFVLSLEIKNDRILFKDY